MRKLLRMAAAASALALAAGGASAAHAAYVFNAEGQSANIDFNGFNDGILDPDLMAKLTLTLFDITANGDFVFDYVLSNHSVGDDADSRLVNFGFNVAPNFGTASIVNGFFAAVHSGNVVAGQPDVEFCATNGATCTAGGPATGTLEVGEIGAGRFLLDFATAQSSVSLDNAQVRWISLGPNNEGSGYGVPIPIPEPATWAMMITGFGLAGAMLRRRRTAVAV